MGSALNFGFAMTDSKAEESDAKVWCRPGALPTLTSALGAEASQMRGSDRLDVVVEDDALDDIADIAAVEHMGHVGHRNNDETAGVA